MKVSCTECRHEGDGGKQIWPLRWSQGSVVTHTHDCMFYTQNLRQLPASSGILHHQRQSVTYVAAITTATTVF